MTTRLRRRMLAAAQFATCFVFLGCGGAGGGIPAAADGPAPAPSPAPSPSPAPAPGPARWGPKTLVTSSTPLYRWASASGTSVHAVYESDALRYQRSVDEGATWQPSVLLPSGGTPYLENPVAADGNLVAVVAARELRSVSDWFGPRPVGNLYAWISRDGGSSFARPIAISTGQGAFRVSVGISGSAIHVVWMDYKNGVWDVYYRRSLDSGQTWGAETRLVSGTPGMGAERPAIAVDASTVHLAWMDGRDNKPGCTIEGGTALPQCTEIYYKRSTNGGQTWGPDTRLTTDAPYSGRPGIAVVAPGTVLITYDHRPAGGDDDVAQLRSTDSGQTWTQSIVASGPGDQTHSTIVGGSGMAWVTWQDLTTVVKTSSDGGATWGANETVSDNSAGVPALGFTTNYVHLIGDSGGLGHWRKPR